MADLDDYGDLFAIDVGIDNYAETAANDAPNVSRTFQSEEAFQRIKESYTAKVDTGDNYEALLKTVPVLRSPDSTSQGGNESKRKLGNKEKNLLGYAVGEMYYDRKFSQVIDLCHRVEMVCVVDTKLGDSLKKWIEICEVKAQKESGV
ncbi:uncharacterized protein RCC_06103 [Ramularia collo-cygni]|uniref:Uncharacterized protein n=1 Tax=Ramularia collo-cygni TaxID=112498 RepID=A0A2D3V0K3_9PEZI|nr:uncharacterized protein RCC_06103 [Ramularia collo-cygni]CZT20245.1 uncharacterized protein RCC_06103 [Ramularia collo-cygni]